MQQTTMNLRPDYTRIAAELNSTVLDQKLEELTHHAPPRKRKRIADLLAPFTERLLKLHGLGWTYRQLADELTACGLPVRVGTLREHLSRNARGLKPRRRKTPSQSGRTAATPAT